MSYNIWYFINEVSLDATLPNGQAYSDILPDRKNDLERRIIESDLCAKISSVLNTLDERCRYIIRERFWHDRTLEDIGKDLGICRERVRQLESKALRSLKEILKELSLTSF